MCIYIYIYTGWPSNAPTGRTAQQGWSDGTTGMVLSQGFVAQRVTIGIIIMFSFGHNLVAK